MLGTWAWGNDGTFGSRYTPADLQPVFEAAREDDLMAWDTAWVYGSGTSEEVLGRFLKEVPRNQCFISDKFTPPHRKQTVMPSVREMYARQLALMNLDRFDVYWIHNALQAPRWTKEAAVFFEDRKDAPLIGVSNHNLEQVKEAEQILQEHGLHLAAVQNHYSLLSRASENSGLLAYCRERGIAFFSYMVLEQGALTGRYDAAHPMPAGSGRGRNCNPVLDRFTRLNGKIAEMADHFGMQPAQIPIAWAAAKGTIPIVGVTKPQHVHEAAKAVQSGLREADFADLEAYAEDLHIGVNRIWEKNVQ